MSAANQRSPAPLAQHCTPALCNISARWPLLTDPPRPPTGPCAMVIARRPQEGQYCHIVVARNAQFHAVDVPSQRRWQTLTARSPTENSLAQTASVTLSWAMLQRNSTRAHPDWQDKGPKGITQGPLLKPNEPPLQSTGSLPKAGHARAAT